MKKSLSLNNRARSTSGARKSESRSHSQGMRSINSVYAAKAATLAKTREPEAQAEAIKKNMKKLSKRIAKAKIFLAVPQSRETDAHKDMRAKLVKWEGLFNRHVAILQYMQDQSEPAKQREVSKLQAKQSIENGEMVRLNNGKLVPSKNGYIKPILSPKRKAAEEAFEKLTNKK